MLFLFFTNILFQGHLYAVSHTQQEEVHRKELLEIEKQQHELRQQQQEAQRQQHWVQIQEQGMQIQQQGVERNHPQILRKNQVQVQPQQSPRKQQLVHQQGHIQQNHQWVIFQTEKCHMWQFSVKVKVNKSFSRARGKMNQRRRGNFNKTSLETISQFYNFSRAILRASLSSVTRNYSRNKLGASLSINSRGYSRTSHKPSLSSVSRSFR